MRTTSLLSIAALSLVLAAPLATVAFAGDHAGDQWRDDDSGRRVTTSYYAADPALLQLEAKVYQQDQARQGTPAPMANSGQSTVSVTK